MSSINLSAPQMQLRQTRNEFRALVGEMKSDNSFPRSMTMKLLMSAGGQKTIGFLLGGTALGASGVASRVGRTLRSLVVGLLMKKIWARIRK